MPTSATGTRRVPDQRGFSLLELLVVVLIAGLMAALVALSFGNLGAVRPEDELRQLADRIALAHEEATLSGRVLGLRATADGFEFVELRIAADERQAKWQAVEADRLLAPVAYAAPLAFTLEVDGAPARPDDATAPSVLLLPDGELTPFSMLLRASDDAAARLRGEADGRLSVERLR
jgi:general secretion pathway protein H